MLRNLIPNSTKEHEFYVSNVKKFVLFGGLGWSFVS